MEVLVPCPLPHKKGSLGVQFAVLHIAAPLHRSPWKWQLIVSRDLAVDVFLKVLEESVPPHPWEQVTLWRLLQWLKQSTQNTIRRNPAKKKETKKQSDTKLSTSSFFVKVLKSFKTFTKKELEQSLIIDRMQLHWIKTVLLTTLSALLSRVPWGN